jgi:hypothetical protein
VTGTVLPRFDRVALGEFCDGLRERGVAATLLSHPEDDPASPLTVDALVRIDGEVCEVWAVDHMRLVYEPDLLPAMDDVAESLRTELASLALECDLYLVVSYLPPGRHEKRESGRAGRRAREREREIFVEQMVAAARQAVTTGNDLFLPDGYTTVQLSRTALPGGERVRLMPWTASDSSLEAQVRAGLAEPLRGKLSGQLARPKAAGYPVMLLIDQAQDRDSSHPSHFLASAGTVRPLVEEILAEAPGIVDQVWLRDRSKRLHRLA